MTKTLELVVEETADHLIDYIFVNSPNVDNKYIFAYEFSGEEIAEGVTKHCAQFSIEIRKTFDPQRPYARTVYIDQLMRAKLLIAQNRAQRTKKYKEQGREIDFAQHGKNWAAPAGTHQEKMTIENKIHLATYEKLKV